MTSYPFVAQEQLQRVEDVRLIVGHQDANRRGVCHQISAVASTLYNLCVPLARLARRASAIGLVPQAGNS